MSKLLEIESAGLHALLSRAREIWGDDRLVLDDIVVRLMVGVGDLARLARDRSYLTPPNGRAELCKELGNVIFSTLRWCDDLGFTPEECVAAAIDAQKRFADSRRPR